MVLSTWTSFCFVTKNFVKPLQFFIKNLFILHKLNLTCPDKIILLVGGPEERVSVQIILYLVSRSRKITKRGKVPHMHERESKEFTLYSISGRRFSYCQRSTPPVLIFITSPLTTGPLIGRYNPRGSRNCKVGSDHCESPP